MPESLKHFAGKILTKLWLFFLFSKVSANFYRYLCEHSNAEQTKMILTIMTSLRGLKSAQMGKKPIKDLSVHRRAMILTTNNQFIFY